MCQALMELLKDEIDEKIEEVRKENRERTITTIQSIAEKLGITPEEAMKLMDIPVAERSQYIIRL